MMNDDYVIERWLPAILLIFVILCLFPLVMQPDGIAFAPDAEFSDIAITHWPYAQWIRTARENWNQIPLWNALIYAGAPFSADPLAGLWYLPLWLTQLIPITLAFNLLFAGHLFSTGWGMYRLMRVEGMRGWGALFAALAWMGASKWAAHIALGHVTFVLAVSWTPWLLLAAFRLSHEERNWLRWCALGGGLLGLTVLIDPRWTLPAGLLTAAYGLQQSLRTHRSVRRLFGSAGVSILAAAGISAPVSLQLLEFVPLSTRAALSAAERMQLSLPVSGLLGFLFPLQGQPEWSTYLGTAVLLLALLGGLLVLRRTAFWLGAVVVGLLFALGTSSPLVALLGSLPGVALLRVPPRWLFVSLFGFAAMAGWGMASVSCGVQGKQLVRSRLAAAGMAAALIFLGTALYLNSDETVHLQLVWAVLAGALGITWLFLCLSTRVQDTLGITGLVLLTALDLARVAAGKLDVHPAAEVLTERDNLAASLAVGELERVLSLSYSVPQQTAAAYGLQLADGVSPMQLKAYAAALSEALGVQWEGYSVTLPAFPDGNPRTPQVFDLNLDQLGKFNVGWIVSDYPLDDPELAEPVRQDGVYVYRNPAIRPRAWLEPLAGGEWVAVDEVLWTPNHIKVQVHGPGRLVLSEMAYPGWVLLVDGERVPVDPYEGLLRSVVLAEGTHVVDFFFRPIHAALGVAWLLLTAGWTAWLWRKR